MNLLGDGFRNYFRMRCSWFDSGYMFLPVYQVIWKNITRFYVPGGPRISSGPRQAQQVPRCRVKVVAAQTTDSSSLCSHFGPWYSEVDRRMYTDASDSWIQMRRVAWDQHFIAFIVANVLVATYSPDMHIKRVRNQGPIEEKALFLEPFKVRARDCPWSQRTPRPHPPPPPPSLLPPLHSPTTTTPPRWLTLLTWARGLSSQPRPDPCGGAGW